MKSRNCVCRLLLLLSTLLSAVTSQCSVCGVGMTVGKPRVTITLPGQPLASCGFIQKVGAEGYIPMSACLIVPGLIKTACGCKPGKTPTVAPLKVSKKPVKAPTLKPVKAPTLKPVKAPTLKPGSSNRNVTAPTLKP